MKLLPHLFLSLAIPFSLAQAQDQPYVSKVWSPDLGSGKYKNPVIDADYSDPDVIRVGEDYYLTASSFDAVPGLPILHSKDLVNWTIIGHALLRQPPYEHFSKTRPGDGVWAPSLRHHQGEFYIYYGDPDFGIYMIKSQDPAGPWDEPVLVEAAKGIIDVCPFWDEDGSAYLVHGFAGSRAGIKSVLAIKRMTADGTKTLDQGVLVYDGHELDPTVEGPKLYKRNGYYYIFAPAGGVATGWQLALRSRHIYGPYERHVAMHQGSSPINGPHQGGWVDTPRGEDWFMHFQDKGVIGRVVHLQPLQWVDDWPVIGRAPKGSMTGEPVLTHTKPNIGKSYPSVTPVESDEFDGLELGKQWQWPANPRATWAFLDKSKGSLRLYTQPLPDEGKNLRDLPNVLLQKFPTESFTATTQLRFTANEKLLGERSGLIVMGRDYAYIALKKEDDGLYLVYGQALKADKGATEQETKIRKVDTNTLYLRVKVTSDAKCQFSYSMDNRQFTPIPQSFTAREGHWIGAKLGLFSQREGSINDAGWGDYDWFRISK
ncbi:glycoside hydrolase family 43 protein [Olivibacter sitiensis]|uniref:glycoside hydrolase family 43 protein n=1 Tax=Olivibacter sitiensis TaxID=376470 RepID=UPI0004139D8A|nr:glycoside hydrolase 43 family protein [Olivibacter sitiensis]